MEVGAYHRRPVGFRTGGRCHLRAGRGQRPITDIHAANGEATVRAIHDAGGVATFIQVDVSKLEVVERMVKEAVGAFGRLDVFWHNAGNVGPGSIENTEEAAYDLTMAIHLKAGFFGAKFALPEMKKAGGGAMLFTSSLAGLKTSRASPVYGIAKAGLLALTRNLTVSFAPHGIRVNAICPGAAETAMWPTFTNRETDVFDPQRTEEVAQMYRERTPLGRLCEPQDVANAALFLCSDLASYVTGEVMSVDGGLSVT